MLERIQDAPANALALEASGTVMARDVEQSVEAALGSTSAATGLVVVISEDFDGYMAELERGLASVSVAHKSIVRIALVPAAGQVDEAKVSSWSGSAVPIRVFPVSERRAALDWAAAARRGE